MSSLSIPNPRLYSNYNIHGELQTYPHVSDVAHGSYVTMGHITPGGTIETLNGDISTGNVVPDAASVLERAGWNGNVLSTDDSVDLMRYADHNGHSFAFNIHLAYEAMWRARGEMGAVQPPPVLPPAGEQGSELYESGHEISAKLPRGTKIRRAVGAFETAWGGINASIEQAKKDVVPPSEEALKLAREGLLSFYYALSSAYQEGRDWITGTEAEECQLACDRVWDAFHAARKRARDAKETGWELVAGDPRAPIFKYSRYNRICWTALSNLTTACGLYGLRGELMEDGQRTAEYVDAFESWDSQDPLRQQVGGDGGINLPGPHFTEAAQKKATA